MGHPQPKTLFIVDNNTADGLTTGTMIPKCSKAIDMHNHWLKCRKIQQQFSIKWKSSTVNRADYHIKHHPASVHKEQCTHYIMNAMINSAQSSASKLP
eukprot:10805761-Ditylum_brightwellii.AAC.1